MPRRPTKPKSKPAKSSLSVTPSRVTKAELEVENSALKQLAGETLKTFGKLGDLPEFRPGGVHSRWAGRNISRLRNRIAEQLVEAA